MAMEIIIISLVESTSYYNFIILAFFFFYSFTCLNNYGFACFVQIIFTSL